MKIGLISSLVFSFLSLLVFSSAGFAKSKHVITHKVLEDETPWFIASVYYGSGALYTKLLTANGLDRAEQIKEGMEIRIEDPKYHQAQTSFTFRYAKLWEGRQKALGLRKGHALPNASVVIPTETIRSQDSTKQLPSKEIQIKTQVSAEQGD